MTKEPMTKLVLTVLFALVVLAGCSWFRPTPQPGDPEVPRPIGGYEEIQKRLYYPEALRESGVEGQVVVKAYIDTAGKVTKTVVTDSLEPELDHIAQRALAMTKFIPASQAGLSVPVWVAFPVQFSLADIPPLSSPYKTVRLEIEPQPEKLRSSARLFLTLKELPVEGHLLELALPFTAETVRGEELIDNKWVPVNIDRQLRDLDEWVSVNITGQQIIISMETRDVPGIYTEALHFSLRMNHQLPTWICEVKVPGDRMLLDSGEYSSQLIESRPDYTAYEIKFPPLAPFETQHMELKLQPR